ncbi:hypothetical protein DSO57_1000288 [Entomophthora muscae]|uniref:Uncharacterized protein n=1 Tax=Entomophthora muscae TaxID=34485 RepID=A0ACC2SYM2_9FUNG|nr:hypothetical protein DSO57_1000288 [Entomophthora muscae]
MDTKSFIRPELVVQAPRQSGVSHSLENICHGRTVVLRVFGRFGCPFARLDAIRLSEQSENLEALGASLVGVGFDENGEREFRTNGFWKGEVYLDHNRSLYKFFQLPHASKLQTMKCLAKKPIRALYASLKHMYGGNFQGDIFQTGGTFVLNCKGQVIYSCPQADIVAFSNLLEILKACKKEFTRRTFDPVAAFTETLKKAQTTPSLKFKAPEKTTINLPTTDYLSPMSDCFSFDGNECPAGVRVARLKFRC